MQPSLFTRLEAVEAELRAMRDLMAELTVNQEGLRRDRDEWRWRAERLLKDQESGPFWRWRRRSAAALDIITAGLSELTVDLRARLAEILVELRKHADARLGRAERATANRRKMDRPLTWLDRIRKAAAPVYRR